MNKNQFFIISDRYFKEFDPENNLKGNKDENRPHFYYLKDIETNMIWAIPMTTKISKYKELIEKDTAKYGKCDKAYITTLADKESVFVIQDIIPVPKEYIERAYTKNDIILELKNEIDIDTINKMAKKLLALMKQGKKLFKDQNNAFELRARILSKLDKH